VSSGPATAYQIASVRSAFDLLFAFLQTNANGGEFGVSELSRRTGQTKNQTFRLLQTLMAAGVVSQNPDTRSYALGYRLIELGSAAQSRSSLVHAARPVLNRLVLSTGDRVMLGRLTSGFATILLDSRDTGPRAWERFSVGSRFALHAGAGSKLLLAYSSPEYLEEYLRIASPLKRFTRYTTVQPSLIREECEQIRLNGYCASCRDLEVEACSVSVPIRNHAGTVIAGLSISSAADTFGEEVRSRNLAMLIAASEEISAKLGHLPA
jgi:DNA-binding IclR family transcriptional regulator